MSGWDGVHLNVVVWLSGLRVVPNRDHLHLQTTMSRGGEHMAWQDTSGSQHARDCGCWKKNEPMLQVNVLSVAEGSWQEIFSFCFVVIQVNAL